MLPALAQVTGGLKVGANAAYQRTAGDDDSSTDLAPGFVGGAFLSLPLSDRIAVQPEVQYSQLGARYDGASDARLYFDEVTVPLLLKLFLVKRRVHLHAGPQIGFVTRAKQESTINNIKLTRDVSDAFRATDYGLVAGIGANLPLRLTLDVRYIYGVPDLAKIRPANFPSTVRLQQHAVQLLLGLRIF